MFSKRILVLAACISSFALSSPRAQQPNQSLPGRPASEPVATKHVRGNLYQVSGGIGNAFFYVGSGGRRWPSLVEIIYQEMTEKK